MIRRPPRSTPLYSSAASDVYKRQMINDFIKNEIIPHFEYGTFIDGEGLWKGEFENTKIFYIEVPESEAIATSVLLKHIADKYRKAFRQESVLVSEVSTQTTFV